MGKRSAKRRHGDARLRVVHGGKAPAKRGTTAPGDAMQPLVVELRRRLRDEDPWQLLAFTSTLVEVSGGPPGPDGVSLAIEGMIETFLGIDLAETTAALSTLAVLVDDEDLRTSITAELSHRTQPMPLWLRDIRDVKVNRAAILSVDGDRGDDLLLGVDWTGTEGGSFVIYVDHGLGTVVKDAFPMAMPFAETVEELRTTTLDEAVPGERVELEELDLAEARGLIETALENMEELGEEHESDTWPAARPILEWLLTTMPEGHTDRWDEPGGWELDDDDWDLPAAIAQQMLEERAQVVADFAASTDASSAGVELTGIGTDDQVMSLIVGGAGLGSAESFQRWTPERIEDLLLGTLPRAVLVDDRIARRIPPLLKAFASWSMSQMGAAEAETVAVRKAVDACAAEYLALATSPEARRLREAVKAYAALLDDEVSIVPVVESDEPVDWDEFFLDQMATEVGGREALAVLATDPLPDEDFDWSVVPPDLRDQLAEIVDALDAFALDRFGVEYRTACRRFLADVVHGAPDAFRRRGTVASAAAVVAWLVGRANGVVGRGGDGMLAGDLWSHFGLRGPSTRADTFRRAVGLELYPPTHTLGRPEWLTSATRLSIVRQRDTALARQAART